MPNSIEERLRSEPHLEHTFCGFPPATCHELVTNSLLTLSILELVQAVGVRTEEARSEVGFHIFIFISTFKIMALCDMYQFVNAVGSDEHFGRNG